MVSKNYNTCPIVKVLAISLLGSNDRDIRQEPERGTINAGTVCFDTELSTLKNPDAYESYITSQITEGRNHYYLSHGQTAHVQQNRFGAMS